MSDSTAVAIQEQITPETVARVVTTGDLAGLSEVQKAEYYTSVCRSIGLNPLTKPFEFLLLNGKLRLYALRDCTDQLRRIHNVSIEIVRRERLDDLYIVTARASTPDGRVDESTGAVTVKGLSGDNLANALMKSETKAKRRVTLSIAGMGWLDENEVDTIPQPALPPKETAEKPLSTKEQNELKAKLIKEAYALCMEQYPSDDEGSIQAKRELVKRAFNCQPRELNRLTLVEVQSGLMLLKEIISEPIPADTEDDVPFGDESPQEATGSTQTTEELQGASVDGYRVTEGGFGPGLATVQQISALTWLAQQVGDDAANDLNAVLKNHPNGLPVGHFEAIESRLKARQKDRKAQAKQGALV